MEEDFLELVNNMLTTGMVPALFSDEEKEVNRGTKREQEGSKRGGEENKSPVSLSNWYIGNHQCGSR